MHDSESWECGCTRHGGKTSRRRSLDERIRWQVAGDAYLAFPCGEEYLNKARQKAIMVIRWFFWIDLPEHRGFIAEG